MDARELFVKELDRLVKEANPKDGSAPLGPVIEIGCIVAREWPELRKHLSPRAT